MDDTWCMIKLISENWTVCVNLWRVVVWLQKLLSCHNVPLQVIFSSSEKLQLLCQMSSSLPEARSSRFLCAPEGPRVIYLPYLHIQSQEHTPRAHGTLGTRPSPADGERQKQERTLRMESKSVWSFNCVSEQFHKLLQSMYRVLMWRVFRFWGEGSEASVAPISHSVRCWRDRPNCAHPFDAKQPLEFRFPNIGRTWSWLKNEHVWCQGCLWHDSSLQPLIWSVSSFAMQSSQRKIKY